LIDPLMIDPLMIDPLNTRIRFGDRQTFLC
jgi:hypothetical protein